MKTFYTIMVILIALGIYLIAEVNFKPFSVKFQPWQTIVGW